MTTLEPISACPRPPTRVALGLLLAMALLTAPAAGADRPQRPISPAVDASPPPGVTTLPGDWRSLQYRARNIAGRFEAELRLKPPAEPGSSWITELTTRMRSLWVRDKETHIRTWFDAANGAVQRFTKLSLGPRPDLKRYEFAPKGVTRVRTEPQGPESKRGPDEWSQVVETFYPVRGEEYGCRVLTEASALLTALARHNGEAMADPGACTFHGKTLYRLSLRWARRSQAELEYTLYGAGPAVKRRDRIESDRFEVVAEPIGGDLAESAEHFTLDVDARSRVPWRISSPTGGLDFAVTLRSVVVASPPAQTAGAPAPAAPAAGGAEEPG